jgi:hypothetical protein
VGRPGVDITSRFADKRLEHTSGNRASMLHT